MIYFKPFDIAHASYGDRPLAIAFFGCISGFVFVLLFYLFPRLFPKVYSDMHWKVWHQILLLIIALFFISTLNGMYINYLMTLPFSWGNYLWIITRTFALASIPVCIIVLLDHNRKLKRYLNAAKDLEGLKMAEENPSKEETISIMDNSDTLSFSSTSILYLEADGNYVSVFEFSDGTIRKSVVRTSLTQTERDNDFNYFARCHRSYIVNLKKVEKVSGNAQGLKLYLKYSDFVIPVSRNYISFIKDYFKKS